MNNILKINLSMLALTVVMFTGCDDEDNTGHSLLTKTNPTLSITAPSTVTAYDSVGMSIPISVTLSKAQIVDIPVYLSQVGGNATEGDDFELSSMVIPAGETEASTTIEVLGDTSPEDVEDLVIQIGSAKTGNTNITPVKTSITINNYRSAHLDLGLSWDISAYDENGEAISPYSIADLRFLLTDYPVTSILDGSDGGSAESFTIFGRDQYDEGGELVGTELADGTYGLYVDFYEISYDLGNNGPADIDLTLTATQDGVFNTETYEIAGALDTSDDTATAVIATLTKVGTTYTIELL